MAKICKRKKSSVTYVREGSKYAFVSIRRSLLKVNSEAAVHLCYAAVY